MSDSPIPIGPVNMECSKTRTRALDVRGISNGDLVAALESAARMYAAATMPHWQAEPYFYSPTYKKDQEVFSKACVALGLKGLKPGETE